MNNCPKKNEQGEKSGEAPSTIYQHIQWEITLTTAQNGHENVLGGKDGPDKIMRVRRVEPGGWSVLVQRVVFGG